MRALVYTGKEKIELNAEMAEPRPEWQPLRKSQITAPI